MFSFAIHRAFLHPLDREVCQAYCSKFFDESWNPYPELSQSLAGLTSGNWREALHAVPDHLLSGLLKGLVPAGVLQQLQQPQEHPLSRFSRTLNSGNAIQPLGDAIFRHEQLESIENALPKAIVLEVRHEIWDGLGGIVEICRHLGVFFERGEFR